MFETSGCSCCDPPLWWFKGFYNSCCWVSFNKNLLRFVKILSNFLFQNASFSFSATPLMIHRVLQELFQLRIIYQKFWLIQENYIGFKVQNDSKNSLWILWKLLLSIIYQKLCPISLKLCTHSFSECFHLDDGLMRRGPDEEGEGGSWWKLIWRSKKNLQEEEGQKRTLVRTFKEQKNLEGAKEPWRRARWRSTRTWVWSGKVATGSFSVVNTRRPDRWDHICNSN